MQYGKEDKKTGIGLSRDVYAEHFAEPGDIKTNYMITFSGDVLLEGEDPKKLADQIMKINERMYKIADFLRRIGSKRPTSDEPTGDKE